MPPPLPPDPHCGRGGGGRGPRRLAHCSETLRLEEEDPAWSEESCVICLVDFAEHDEVDPRGGGRKGLVSVGR